jgi:hypothetical protein
VPFYNESRPAGLEMRPDNAATHLILDSWKRCCAGTYPSCQRGCAATLRVRQDERRATASRSSNCKACATLSQDDRSPRFIIKEVLWESAIASPGCAGPTPQQRTSSSALLLEIRGCFAGVSTPRQRAKCFQAKGAEIFYAKRVRKWKHSGFDR